MIDVYVVTRGKEQNIPDAPFPNMTAAHNGLRLWANRRYHRNQAWQKMLDDPDIDAYGFIIHRSQDVKTDIIIHVPTK